MYTCWPLAAVGQMSGRCSPIWCSVDTSCSLVREGGQKICFTENQRVRHGVDLNHKPCDRTVVNCRIVIHESPACDRSSARDESAVQRVVERRAAEHGERTYHGINVARWQDHRMGYYLQQSRARKMVYQWHARPLGQPPSQSPGPRE